MADNYKPQFQPWNEEEFQSDIYVRVMSPVQRWMYRTLLQAAFFGSERPYLPDDDELLWMLAGCESPKQWAENKSLVLRRFKQIVINGTHLLVNKRVEADWAKLDDHRDEQRRKSELGVEARRRAAADQRATHGSSVDNQEKLREVKISEEKRSETGQPTADRSEEQGSTARLAEGQPGYYAEGQYSFLNNPKKVCDRMRQIWQDLIGKSATARKPMGKGWDWFTDVCEECEIDVLIPAFELWAVERGKFNAERIDSPVMEFLKDDYGTWTKKVLPLNTFDEKSSDIEITEQMIEENKNNLGFQSDEDELAELEATQAMIGAGLDDENRARLESRIETLKRQIAQAKA